jgi:D-2-hydroxyacid dehydrogenase (NADP+)
MKPTSFLINIGRGGIVDEEALIAALRAGQIAGAGVDVFCEEPLPKHHPFSGLKNVIIIPHVGGHSDIYEDQVMSNLRGKPAPLC